MLVEWCMRWDGLGYGTGSPDDGGLNKQGLHFNIVESLTASSCWFLQQSHPGSRLKPYTLVHLVCWLFLPVIVLLDHKGVATAPHNVSIFKARKMKKKGQQQQALFRWLYTLAGNKRFPRSHPVAYVSWLKHGSPQASSKFRFLWSGSLLIFHKIKDPHHYCV